MVDVCADGFAQAASPASRNRIRPVIRRNLGPDASFAYEYPFDVDPWIMAPRRPNTPRCNFSSGFNCTRVLIGIVRPGTRSFLDSTIKSHDRRARISEWRPASRGRATILPFFRSFRCSHAVNAIPGGWQCWHFGEVHVQQGFFKRIVIIVSAGGESTRESFHFLLARDFSFESF